MVIKMLNDLTLLMKDITLIILLAPLLGCLIAGLLGYKIGRFWTSFFTILFLAVSLGLSIYLMLKMTILDPQVKSFRIHFCNASTSSS